MQHLKEGQQLIMNIQEAKRAGAEAFAAGRGLQPALNQQFVVAACAAGDDLAALLEGYVHGWTIAKLAQGAPLPDMPGIGELKAILEA